ncbi:MAG: pyridoxal kinase PdxY [Treponema sp.]|jgi:pyridoxine kinase|nr:pyridoxal kinase PdxY [Treponema sp.]
MAILSIQSHVVCGYAGNAAAVFPLQRLGREVWAINTVEFSNHTGYGAWRGKILDPSLVLELVEGLEDRGVLPRCEAVLSGYLGDAASARGIIEAVKKVKTASPAAVYCCDPVMGDVGRGFYVHPDIPDMFRNEVIPLADIVTPNQFELEALTGMDSSTVDGARRAVEKVHRMGPQVVLVTSFREGGEGRIGMLASGPSGIFKTGTAEFQLGRNMAGSGDLTASVFLSRYLETADVKRALELCTASVFGIIEATWQAEKQKEGGGKNAPPPELRLVQAQEELLRPSHFFRAEKL